MFDIKEKAKTLYVHYAVSLLDLEALGGNFVLLTLLFTHRINSVQQMCFIHPIRLRPSFHSSNQFIQTLLR